MQRLADTAWSQAGASLSRSEIVRVSGYERPVAINDGLHQLMVLPARHAPPGDMCASSVSCFHGNVDQDYGQALVDKELHECLPLFNARPSG